jgi:hypothetical protein
MKYFLPQLAPLGGRFTPMLERGSAAQIYTFLKPGLVLGAVTTGFYYFFLNSIPKNACGINWSIIRKKPFVEPIPIPPNIASCLPN